MAKSLREIKTFAAELRGKLDPLLEDKGMGYNYTQKFFDQVTNADNVDSAAASLRGVLKDLGNIIASIKNDEERRYVSMIETLEGHKDSLEKFIAEIFT